MSLDKVEQTKQSKPFKALDLALYAVILLVTAVLLIVFVMLPEKTSLTASGAVAEIALDGEVVFDYNFANGAYKIYGGAAEIQANENGKTAVIVYADGNRHDYNIIVFDEADGGGISVHSANCSFRRDCTFMTIKKSGDVIICIPHRLKVYIKSTVDSPVTG